METVWIEAVANAGTGAVIALFLLLGLYRIASRLGVEFIKAQNAQAEALARQAQSMEGLRESLQGFVSRDGSEHREMLVLLRFLAQEHNEMSEVRLEHRERKEQAHPYCPAKCP